MKRYMALILELLRFAESKENLRPAPPPEMEGCTPEQVHHHVSLCEQAGYLVVERTQRRTCRRFAIVGLAWNGHEKIDGVEP